MGRVLILLTVAMTGLFGTTNLNIMQSNTRMLSNSVQEYSRVQARQLAASGIQLGIMHLFQDTTWSGVNNINMGGGTLDVTVQNTRSRYVDNVNMNENGKRITSTGTVDQQSITSYAVVQFPLVQTAPPFLRYALASDGDLDLGGNIDVSIQDDLNDSLNTNVHTNHNLKVNGSSKVSGFGTYSGSISLLPNDEERFFEPAYNPGGLPLTKQNPEIEIPGFDPNEYLGIATQITHGNLTLSGNQSLGTSENPKIWYIDGDLQLSGQVSGYGVFIVTGDIQITANTTITAMDPLGNNLGLYSGSNIDVAGNASIEAQMFAANNVVLRGNNDLVGMASAGNQIDIQGNVDVHYRPVSNNLTAPFWQSYDLLRPRIVSYYQ